MNEEAALDIEDIYPLSGMQQLLLMHALRPGSPDGGFLHYRCTFHGELDADSLRRAWGMVLARSDILRASFAWDGLDEPMQVVHRTVDLPWSLVDWSADGEAAQADRLDRLMAEDRARGFDLAAAPLIRVNLVRLATDRHLMLWSHHHIQTDGWSVAVVIRELISCYRGLRQGAAPALALRRPFRDYIAWLKERDLGAAQRYWSGLLHGFAAPTRIAAVAPGARADNVAGSLRVRRQCPGSMLRALEQRAAAAHVTLNTLFSAAWALVLAQRCGASDVVFGSTVSGRPPALAGVEDMVGTFINNLPVRIQIRPEQDLGPWLEGIFRQQLCAQEFDYPPLFRLEEWSEIPARDRLFDSLVLFDNTPDTTAIDCGDGLRLGDTDGSLTSALPFTLFVRCREQLELEATVHPSRLTGAQAAGILAQLAAVLARLAEPATSTVAELSAALDACVAVPSAAVQGPRLADAGGAGAPPIQPHQRTSYIPLHNQLQGIWQELLGIGNIAITDDFFALGGHSLLAARMLAQAGRLINCAVPMTLLFEGPTIERLSAAMLREFAPQHRPLIELTPGEGKPPFFLLHGDLVGGGYYTVELARLLGPDQPFQVIAPLPVARGQAPPTIAAIANEHLRQIRAVRPHGPYRLGGYCNGGVVMYELACQLVQAGETVEFLGLIDASVASRRHLLICRAIELAGALLGLSVDRQLRLPNELRKKARDMLTRWWKPRQQPEDDVMEDGEGDQEGDHLLRAYLWSLARYRPQRFPGRLNLYMADNGSRRLHDPTEGWAAYAGQVEVRTLPGHHFDIITNQVGYLAAELSKDLSRAADLQLH